MSRESLARKALIRLSSASAPRSEVARRSWFRMSSVPMLRSVLGRWTWIRLSSASVPRSLLARRSWIRMSSASMPLSSLARRAWIRVWQMCNEMLVQGERQSDLILCAAKMVAGDARYQYILAADAFGRDQPAAASVSQYVARSSPRVSISAASIFAPQCLRGAAMLRDSVRSLARCDPLCGEDGRRRCPLPVHYRRRLISKGDQSAAASAGQYIAVLRRDCQYRPPQFSHCNVRECAAMLRDRVRS